MFKYIFTLLLAICSVSPVLAYQVSSGKLDTIRNFDSNYVDSRDVHVWLPEHYASLTKQGKQFSVLYMHDGQMLFDGNKTWNKQEWGVDEVAEQLMSTGLVKHFIVVGIDNNGTKRRSEYFPQKAFNTLPKDKQKNLYSARKDNGEMLFGGYIQSDNYLKFIVKELKPYIDNHYKVLTDRENTFIMGSSMGALISLYAISEYPQVFGAAACMSTHWPGDHSTNSDLIPDAIFSYMRTNLASAKNHQIYFDYGTETLDTLYPPLQRQANSIMREKGYDDTNWLTRRFKGAKHTETDWNQRLHVPLLFLLGK